MRQHIKAAILITVCCASSLASAVDDVPSFIEEARQATALFQTALKKEMQTAMRAGGLAETVEVCHSRAPKIAQEIGRKTGWEMSRTSLKTRNKINTPGTSEHAVLAQFETRKASGEAIKKLEWWQKNEEGVITYMKAIPMQRMCAGCHGKNITPALKDHITQHYPYDAATDFDIGDIRGAFILKRGQ